MYYVIVLHTNRNFQLYIWCFVIPFHPKMIFMKKGNLTIFQFHSEINFIFITFRSALSKRLEKTKGSYKNN